MISLKFSAGIRAVKKGEETHAGVCAHVHTHTHTTQNILQLLQSLLLQRNSHLQSGPDLASPGLCEQDIGYVMGGREVGAMNAGGEGSGIQGIL